MTTTVRILIDGNKNCEIVVEGSGVKPQPKLIGPGCFHTVMIHGDQKVVVREVGNFLQALT